MQVVLVIVIHEVVGLSGTDLQREVKSVVFLDIGDVKVLEVILAYNVLLKTVFLAENLISLTRGLLLRLLS